MSDSLAFRQALSQFATGVAVVTTRDKAGAAIGMTINSFSSVSLTPKLVLWSIDKSAAGYDDYIACDRHVIQVLTKEQQSLSDQFAQRGIDKFENVTYSDLNGMPALNGASAYFVCEPYKQVDAGDHTVIIATVTDFSADGGTPLMFHNGNYC